MSHDTWYRRRGEGVTLDNAYNDSFLLLKGRLAMAKKSLRDFLAMAPVGIERVNPLIEVELDYDREALRAHVERSLPFLSRNQDRAVASILNVVHLDQGDVFFLDGPGGSGKMFVYSVLLASVRNEGHVALAITSSGIVALLLQGGRTSHSTFKIPIDIHRDSLCNVNASSDTAELIRVAKLIVWDEAPTQHRHCAEVINRTFRNVLQQTKSPFGEKVIVFGGDIR
jgi:ATP-dependent DNA helicase PIF1